MLRGSRTHLSCLQKTRQAYLTPPPERTTRENRILRRTGKCLTWDFDSNQDTCPTWYEEFIPGSVLFPGPVLACGRPSGSRPHPRKRKRKKPQIPCHTRPGSPKRPLRKGGALRNYSKHAPVASPWQPRPLLGNWGAVVNTAGRITHGEVWRNLIWLRR